MRHFPTRFRKSRMNESRHNRRHMLRESKSTITRLESHPDAAVDFLCGSIMSLTNDDFMIEDEDLANFVGRWAVRNALEGTFNETLEDFVSEVQTLFSGSPLDGSYFGASEAAEYAEEVWNERE